MRDVDVEGGATTLAAFAAATREWTGAELKGLVVESIFDAEQLVETAADDTSTTATITLSVATLEKSLVILDAARQRKLASAPRTVSGLRVSLA